MTDPDANALLRAIVRDPDDDTTRLVYADWLQENGRPEEGEFVRTQCRLAAAAPDDPEYPALLDRDGELRLWLGTHAPAPRPTFPGGLSVDGAKLWWWQAHRGFPRFLEFDGYERRSGAKAMRGLAAALGRAFEALPTRWLVVRNLTAAQLAALLKQPVLAGLSRLTVQLAVAADEGAAAARALAACRHLRHLRGLLLYFPFGDAGCEALAAGPWGELAWFASPCHEVSAAGLRALAGAPWFRRLRELTLTDDFPPDAFEALVRLPPLPDLHTLDLSRDRFPGAAWQEFGRARTFPALKRLELGHGDLSDGRFAALAGATGFALAALNAHQCGAGPGSGAALVRAPWAAGLRALNLGYNGLEPADVRAVAASRARGDLRHLDLSGNAPGATGLAAFAANPALRGLRALWLGGGEPHNRGLTPAHFDRFLAKLDLPDLRHLDLSGRPVGATAAKRLAGPTFAPLRRLVLKGCRLSDAAAAKLLTAPALQNLVQLDLSDNGLGPGLGPLGDPAVLPNLASCALGGNPVPAAVVRKLRARAGVSGLPKPAVRRS